MGLFTRLFGEPGLPSRGCYVAEEVGLPEDFEPPSGAITPPADFSLESRLIASFGIPPAIVGPSPPPPRLCPVCGQSRLHCGWIFNYHKDDETRFTRC